MSKMISVTPLFILLIFHLASAETIIRDGYIVQMNNSAIPKSFDNPEKWYSYILQSVVSSNSTTKPQLGRIYSQAIQGFSARLSSNELQSLGRINGFISAYSSDNLTVLLHTTYTPEFLSLNDMSGLWPTSNYGDNIVVGIIDSGIWPESPSFRDDGMSPVPSWWKGECDVFDPNSRATLCNRKLVGARFFNTEETARDLNGHGTCTASIVAGNYVLDASYFGYANGTSVGIAPSARVAVYNVAGYPQVDLSLGSTVPVPNIWVSDVLAGIDAAIVDGVDIILVPLGISTRNVPLYQDPLAIAAFSANKKGIPIIFSAGNEGLYNHTVSNGFPWALTVGASSIDRKFGGRLTLGNGLVIEGFSLFPARALVLDVPLVYNESISQCFNESLLLAGHIVICSNVTATSIYYQMWFVERSDVAGAIFISDNISSKEMGRFNCPGIMISSSEAQQVIEYASSSDDPRATIEFQQTYLGVGLAPTVASYSSRGPNPTNLKDVLKPDLIAPGTRVLAAWPTNQPAATIVKPSSPESNPNEANLGVNLNLASNFIIKSGTSLAAAHVAGVAALLKAAHPEWSPAAIRSAMMTTADPFDKYSRQPITDDGAVLNPNPKRDRRAAPLAMGAGHVDPNKALEPGLIYDADEEEYVGFLCGRFTEEQVIVITGSTESHVCSKTIFGLDGNLNYPSFIAFFPPKNSSRPYKFTKQLVRTVTNVGNGPVVYKPVVIQPEGYLVSVNQDKLVFRETNEKLNFFVNIEEKEGKEDGYSDGSVTWVDEQGKHAVRSPVAIVIEDPAIAGHEP